MTPNKETTPDTTAGGDCAPPTCSTLMQRLDWLTEQCSKRASNGDKEAFTMGVVANEIREIWETLITNGFMAYRNRDPETGELCNHFTVVNEDKTTRRGVCCGLLEEAITDAFMSND